MAVSRSLDSRHEWHYCWKATNLAGLSDDTSRVREAYGDHTYRRLAEVKAQYDPDNAFHHSKNIRPD
jgi:FAD/FMN-containing dehydrogenase